ncbi:MAG TPA: cyclase family protein [Streptosporangiaceae bacterium]|nr:cyclase family protein [Streptosporangiaceae bacterium]
MAPFGFSRVVFLSHVLGPGAPVFPGDPRVEIHQTATIERDGYHLHSLVTGEQSGTHWAAPAHFHAGAAAADELDPGDFFFPAVVIRWLIGERSIGHPGSTRWESTRASTRRSARTSCCSTGIACTWRT